MSWYDVELLELAPDYDAAEVAGVLGVEPRSLRALALPATVRRGLSESDAEVLFHHLHRAGAQVRLQASLGPRFVRILPSDHLRGCRLGLSPVCLVVYW